MIRIVIADDHHLVREGIRALLEKADDIEVIGEAADGREAVAEAERLRPDEVIMDIAMPQMNGIQAIQRIKAIDGGIKIVVLSMYSDRALVRQAISSGAGGYLLKRSVTEELIATVRALTRGELFISPAVAEENEPDYATTCHSPKSGFASLSSREIEVLQLIAEGYTNTAIARALNVAVKTVEKHRASLSAKLNIHDTAGLVKVALRKGLTFLE